MEDLFLEGHKSYSRSNQQTPDISYIFQRRSKNTTPNSTLVKKKKRRYLSSRALNSGKLFSPSSVKSDKTTINYLLNYNRMSRPNLREEAPVSVIENTQEAKSLNQEMQETRKTFQKRLKELSQISEMSNLQRSLESLCSTVVHSQWFEGNSKLKMLLELHYVEKLLHRAILQTSELVKSFEETKDNYFQLRRDSQNLEHQMWSYKNKYKSLKSKFSKSNPKKLEETYTKKQREWNLERAKYEELIESLTQNRVEKEHSTMACESPETQTKLQESSQLLQKRQVTIAKLQHQLGLAKDKVAQQAQTIEDFQNLKSSFVQQVEKLSQEKTQVELRTKKLLDQLGMLQEELLFVDSYKDQLKQAREEHQKVESKYQQLLNSIFEERDSNLQDVEIKVPLTDPIFSKHPKKNSRKFKTLNLQSHKHLKPSFGSFCSVPKGSYGSYIPPFENWVFCTVRGILDSKYYEHCLCKGLPLARPSKLTEFVFGWLGEFCVDETSRSVRKLEWWKKESAQEIRLNFLLGLSHEDTKKNWELQTFKEFLEEEMMLDELGFYLHCRFTLFRGPQLNHANAKYSKMNFVPLEKIETIAEELMQGISKEDMEDLLCMLREKSLYKKQTLHIETSLVLRVMLEFYRKEKAYKLELVKDMLSSADESGASFDFFSSVCRGLNPSISDMELCRFYRECWNLGAGKVNSEVFLLVANESDFLYSLLSLNQTKKQNSSYYEKWNNSKQEAELIQKTLDRMGVCELTSKLNYFENTLSKQVQKNLGTWSAEDYYNHFWCLCLVGSLAFSEFNASDIGLLGLKESFDHKEALSQFLRISKGFFIRKLNMKLATRKIQKTWRNKAKSNIGLVATVVKSVGRFKRIIKNISPQKN